GLPEALTSRRSGSATNNYSVRRPRASIFPCTLVSSTGIMKPARKGPMGGHPMKRQLAHVTLTLALSLGFSVAAKATVLVSDLGIFGSPNDVVERQFTYNPATMGTQLIIQTFGWGGTANQPGGTNASGIVIPP